MRITIETFDANGALKTAIATVPAHGHTGSSDGGQLNAGSVFSAGLVPLARGGTHTDLSATGGTSKVLWQESAAADITVRVIADADLPTTLAGKTLTTPTIASLANANHTHADSAGGGNLGANAFSDQSANRVLAGPTSGGAAEPTFRLLNVADTTAGGLYPYIGFAQVSYATSGATDGGTATSGAWRTYSMNTEDYDVGSNVGAIASNQFTLAAGTYDVEFDAQLYKTDLSKIRLYDTTNTTSLVESQSAFVSSVDSVQQTLVGYKRITITGTPTLELQYYCQTTQSGNGLGNQYNTASSTQIFARVRFLRVA